MTAPNPNTLAPSLPFREKGDVVVDVQIAQNTPRQGPKLAEEGLGWAPPYPGAFHESVMKSDDAANHAVYERQRAGQEFGRGRLGSGQQIPAWDVVRPEETSSFASAVAFGDPGQAQPYPHYPRDGANMETLAPTAGLNRGERQNTQIVHAMARNPRNRINPATVFGAEDVR
jgi:hypothetical protein